MLQAQKDQVKGYSLGGGKSATEGQAAQAAPPSYQPVASNKPAPVNGVKVPSSPSQFGPSRSFHNKVANHIGHYSKLVVFCACARETRCIESCVARWFTAKIFHVGEASPQPSTHAMADPKPQT